jgi:hypothetical protein
MVLRRIPLATDHKMNEMMDEQVLFYFTLPPESLPEAFPEYNRGPTVEMLPKSGCTGLQVCTRPTMLADIVSI